MNSFVRILLVFAAVMLSACASFSSIQPGQTAADVEKTAGAPTDRRTDAGGGQTWEYNLLPEGRRIYLVDFGADGRVRQVRQSLTPENFANIRMGQSSRDEVLRLLGKPSGRYVYSRTGEEVWEYQFFADQWRMLLDVYFGAADGIVRRYATMVDVGHHYSPSAGDN